VCTALSKGVEDAIQWCTNSSSVFAYQEVTMQKHVLGFMAYCTLILTSTQIIQRTPLSTRVYKSRYHLFSPSSPAITHKIRRWKTSTNSEPHVHRKIRPRTPYLGSRKTPLPIKSRRPHETKAQGKTQPLKAQHPQCSAYKTVHLASSQLTPHQSFS
jgi:hypothetical protein